jgi:hypothetical protein
MVADMGWHNDSMRRVGGWIGPRDAVLSLAAAAIGLAVAQLDSQPTWDDTGITVSLILLTSALMAGLSTRRPWLWALLIGVWIPIFEIGGKAGAASLLALLMATIGAFAGYAVVRVAEPA